MNDNQPSSHSHQGLTSVFEIKEFIATVVTLVTNMPFTDEDKIIIKHYRQFYKWGSQKILSTLGEGKDWTRPGVEYIIQKIDATGSHERRKGSGRPRSVRTEENVEEVEEEIFSQEDPESEEWKPHESSRASTEIGYIKGFCVSNHQMRSQP